jgi:hypothetical protein
MLRKIGIVTVRSATAKFFLFAHTPYSPGIWPSGVESLSLLPSAHSLPLRLRLRNL